MATTTDHSDNEDTRELCRRCLVEITTTDHAAGRCTNCGHRLVSDRAGKRLQRPANAEKGDQND